MKMSFRIFTVAIAICFALVSCDKEDSTISVDVKGKTRVISVTFAGSQTRSALDADGLTPKFVAGDAIMISNGIEAEECTVVINGGSATVSTSLSGSLIAVYPSSAWSNSEPYFKVPAEQDGTFASANICKAAIAEDGTSATFENQTAVFRFYVDASIGVKSLTIESSTDIATDSKTISISHGGTTLDNFTDGPDKRLCYAAILGGVNASTISLTSETTTQGTVTRPTPMANITLAAGTMYNAFIPYYIKVNTPSASAGYQKWGYCNVGAFLPEETGLFFQWGETAGHRINADKTAAEDGYVFNWANLPFNNGNTSFNETYFNSVKGVECPSGVLAMKNDAANVNWGGSWRMPVLDDAVILVNYQTAIAKDTNGCYFGEAPNQIYLPFGGLFSGSTFYQNNYKYWCGQISPASQLLAYCIDLSSATMTYGSLSRVFGMQIRPILD